MRGENSSREGSSEAVDECRLGMGDLSSTGEAEVNQPLMISFEDSVGTIAIPGPSP
jgi:hypothetical protein